VGVQDVMKAAFGTPAQVGVVLLVLIITFLTPVVRLHLCMSDSFFTDGISTPLLLAQTVTAAP
jgi:hypothetical protein